MPVEMASEYGSQNYTSIGRLCSHPTEHEQFANSLRETCNIDHCVSTATDVHTNVILPRKAQQSQCAGYWLRFYIPFNTKYAISETFPKPIFWLCIEKQNLTPQKHTFTNQ